MEDVNKDRDPEGSRGPQRGSSQTLAEVRPNKTTWSQVLSAPRPGDDWYSCAPVAVLWSVCRADEPPDPSVCALDACGRLLLVCLLWIVAGGGVQALKRHLQPSQDQFKGESPQRIQQEVVAENRNNQYSWESPSRGPGRRPPLALALADGLLLCVLQEPLAAPGVPHIQALLCRLESVFRTLEKADPSSEATLEAMARDAALTDKVKLIYTYLQQRTGTLRTVVRAQEHFEARVTDVLRGLDGLWAQLEELHTEVTITKEASRGRRDLAAARADAQTLFSVSGHYRNELQSCQANMKCSTQLLQELMWSHAHISDSVSGCGESLWPELLLQSNMEQLDRAQERFLSLEQQTCAFQAHLEGLGLGTRETHARALAHTNESCSCAATPQTYLQPHGSTSGTSREHSGFTASALGDEDADTDAEAIPLSLCERSALRFSSTIGRLRKSGRRK